VLELKKKAERPATNKGSYRLRAGKAWQQPRVGSDLGWRGFELTADAGAPSHGGPEPEVTPRGLNITPTAAPGESA